MLATQIRTRLKMYSCKPQEFHAANSPRPEAIGMPKAKSKKLPQEDGKMAYRWVSSVDRALEALKQEISDPKR